MISNMEVVASIVITLLYWVFMYILLPVVCVTLAILMLIVSIAFALVVKSRYKGPNWFLRKPKRPFP